MKKKENVGVEEQWRLFKKTVMLCAEVYGMKCVSSRVREGSEWWCKR